MRAWEMHGACFLVKGRCLSRQIHEKFACCDVGPFVFWSSPAYISVLKLLCSYQQLARHTSGRKPTF